MKYLITGVAGFIGSHLAETLIERGDEVRGLDDFSTGHRHNIAAFLDDMEFIEGDIRDLETCRRACKGVDYVLHQAALGSVPRSVDDPIATHEVNATGTLNMLVAARDADVDAFVFAASSSAYGDTDVLPKQEAMKKRPLSPYAVTKVACENYLEVFSHVYGMNTVGLRYFNIFGPRQDPDGPYAAVIPKFIILMLDGETPVIYGDGEQTRDFTYVANAVQANLLAVENAASVSGEIFNVGCGDRISLNQLYAGLREHTGFDRDAEHGPERPGDVRDSLADIERARTLLGYEPDLHISEGLSRTVDWFRDQDE